MGIFLRDLLKTRGIRTFELELLAFGPTPGHRLPPDHHRRITPPQQRIARGVRLSIQPGIKGAGGIRKAQKQLRPRAALSLLYIPFPLSERAGLDVWSPCSILKGSGPALWYARRIDPWSPSLCPRAHFWRSRT